MAPKLLRSRYSWELPTTYRPLEDAVRRIAGGHIDVVLFTSSIQLDHLLEIARRLALEESVGHALTTRTAMGSIGPVMTDCLNARGVPPDIIPRHPKIWALVKAASEEASAALARKSGDG